MRLASGFVTYPQGAGRFDKPPAVAREDQRRKPHVTVSQLHGDERTRAMTVVRIVVMPNSIRPLVPQGFWNM